jgi:putative peptidoglycan lipid II flippase
MACQLRAPINNQVLIPGDMTTHKTVAKAAGLMMVAILLSRMLGLFRDMAIASKFGQGALVSAYTVAFNLPDLLYFFMSSGALSGAFIPVFTERFHTGRQKEAWQIFSIIACFMGLVLGAVIIISEIFTVPLVKTLAAPGYADNKSMISLISLLTRIILPCQFFFFLGALMMGTLEARQNFKARAAGPVIYNLGIIFGVIVLSRWMSIAGLAWGALIGAFAGNIAFTFYHLKREGFEFHPSLNLKDPGVVKVGALALPVILGLSLPQIDVLVNRYFATMLGDVAPAALNFGNRLMQVPLGVFAQAAGTAILPTLSAYAAKGAINELRTSLSFGLRAILALNIPASLFMVVMADPIIRAVYMSGQFTSADVGPAKIALIFYSVGIFAWAGQAIVARGFFAMQDTITPVIIGTVVTVIFIPLNIILMRTMGHGGLALATSIAATIHLIGLMIFLRKRICGIEGRSLLVSVTKVIIASLIMSSACYGVKLGLAQVIDIYSRKGAAITLLAAMFVAIVIYTILLKVFKVEEAGFIWSMIKRRFSKTPNGNGSGGMNTSSLPTSME